MKKVFIITLIVLVLSLTVLCGCNKEAENISAGTATVTAQNENSTTSATDESGFDSQYIPDNTEENELEILTIPQADGSSNETQPTENTTQTPATSGADNAQSETKIELPFVPVQ